MCNININNNNNNNNINENIINVLMKCVIIIIMCIKW